MPVFRAQHAADVLDTNGDVLAVLAADDERGTKVGLVVQADEIRWDAIDALLDLAVYGRLAHRRAAHAGSGGHGCAKCAAADAMWSGGLVDPVAARRGTTATALHDEMRRQVEQDLATNDE